MLRLTVQTFARTWLTLQRAHSSSSSLDMCPRNPLRMHFSTQPQTLEMIHNYENLLTRIGFSDSIADLIKIYIDNEDSFRCEHLAQTARQIGRLQVKIKPEMMNVFKEAQFIRFTEKSVNNIQKFNDQELLDILFWIRKYKSTKGTLGQMESKTNEVIDRILDLSKKDGYKFKQLATIFFDLSHIGRNCDDIASKLTGELNKDSSQLTPFICLNILQSIALKKGNNSGKELILVDLLCKLLPAMAPQFDVNQKALIFKLIALVEPFIHPPKYKMPQIMFQLKNELKEDLESLNEVSAINILNAYRYLLNSHFPLDLLEEIREMVLVTVKHNPQNIKSTFLIDFLESVVLVSKKKKSQTEKLNILISELTKRVKEGDETVLGFKIEKLANYCDQYVKNQSSLIKELAKQFETKIKTNFNQNLLELFSKKAPQQDFDKILNVYFGEDDKSIEQKVDSFKVHNKNCIVRLAICLSPHKERHEFLFQKVSKAVDELIEADPFYVIVQQKNCLVNNTFKRDLQIKSVSKYIAGLENETDGQIIKAISASNDIREVRLIWFTQYFKSRTLDTSFVSKVLHNIAAIIRLPQQYIQQESAFILKTMKEHINSISDTTTYTNIFTALPSKQGEINSTLVKQLRSHFPQIQKHLQLTDIRKILQKMVKLDMKDHQVLTNILQEIGNHFYQMTCEDRVLCLEAYCSMFIKQVDFIEKCLQTFIESFQSYRNYLQIIVDSLFKVGYESEQLSEYLMKALKLWKLSSSELKSILFLVAIAKSQQANLAEEIALKIKMLNQPNQQQGKLHQTQQNLMLVYALSPRFQNNKYAEITKFLEKQQKQPVSTSPPVPMKILVWHPQYYDIQKFLTAMGVEFQTNCLIDKYEIPLAIPSMKQIIKVNGYSNLNFDGKTLDGRSIIESLILECIPEHQVISINMKEFNALGADSLAKINYLLKAGIKCDSKSKYDFSKCKSKDVQVEEPVIQEESHGQVEETSEDLAPFDEDILSSEEDKINKKQA